MTGYLSSDQKIIYTVGALVLCYHEIERYLKFIVPFTDENDYSFTSVISRQNDLSRKSLGEVTGKFVDSFSGDTEAFRTYFKEFVGKRNSLVHHFSNSYGKLIKAERHDEVLELLNFQHREAVSFMKLLQEMALTMIEVMRDTSFKDTEQFDEVASICEMLKKSLQAN